MGKTDLPCPRRVVLRKLTFSTTRGKKTGTKVSWKHYHTIKLRKAINDPNASFMIQNATVQMDWPAFYRA
jgi:hypothetical protein